MKKLLFLILLLPLFIGCSSSNTQKRTIQMNSIKWTWEGSWLSEEDFCKQMSLFDLVPGPQQLMVTVEKDPGETWYFFDLFLNVRLNHSVDLDLTRILADKDSKRSAMSCAEMFVILLDRNGERIQRSSPMGPIDCSFYFFNQYDGPTEEEFVNYLTFLKSEPGTVITLHAIAGFCAQEVECSVGFANLINEIKDIELKFTTVDREFEKYVGVIDSDTNHSVEMSWDYTSINIADGEHSEEVAQREQEVLMAQESESIKNPNGHSYVDLGLPSGLWWASCNLGASSSADTGAYYSWGETTDKYEYSQSSYSCNLGIDMLSSSYDAAAMQWGGSWRIPTSEEWQELSSYCSWSWNGEGYVVKGRNGNTIYLPAAGYSKGSTRFKSGERGDYWSSNPCGSDKAYEFVIKSDAHQIENDSRHYGLSIRPVL